MRGTAWGKRASRLADKSLLQAVLPTWLGQWFYQNSNSIWHRDPVFGMLISSS